MIITKYAKQKAGILERTHPDLYKTLDSQLPDLSDEDKGKVAGLIIEYVIKSKGNVVIFQDEFDIPNEEDDDDFI